MNNKEIVDKVLSESRKIENFLNDKMLPEFAKLHGIKNEYSKFDLKQEVVARNSLFFDVKKRYSLYIINREGMDRDEYDNRGITIRRSDYPSYTKEMLQKILDMLLQSEYLDIGSIWKFIQDVEIDIKRMILDGDKRIARPITCKDKNSYKKGKLPSHMLGAELWNDLEYEYFLDGSKGYQFKITGVDTWDAPDRILDKMHIITPKNNNIALPFEEDKLPEYYNVDVESMLKFAWTDRYMELLKPIISGV